MPAHLDRTDEDAPIPAKSDSPLPSPVLPTAGQHSPHSTADHHRQHQPPKSSSAPGSTPAVVAAVAVAPSADDHSQLSAVRRTLAHVPEVDAIEALFRFDRKKHVLGSGMYATVFRALPTLDACRRFDLPVALSGATTAATAPAARRSSSLPTSPMTPAAGSTGGASSQPSNCFPRGNSADGGTDADGAVPPSAATRVAVSGPVALKEVQFASIADAKEARNVLREISVLRRLRHPHVASLIGAVRTKTAVYIVMPLAPGVTLTKLLRAAQRDGVALPEKAVSGIVEQLLLALRHVQRERGMIHRDVKLDNVLVAVSSLAVQPPTPPSCGGNRQSSNKAPGETAEATSPWCLDAITGMDPCDPAETLAHLFEPGATIHVTLVDFGFARSVSAPSAQATTACESSVVSPVLSSCAHFPPTPSLPTAARGRQQGGGGNRSPPPPSVGSPSGCCAPSSLAAAAAKVAYTPCGAHRFMPPEALAALLRAGSGAPPVPLVAHPASPPKQQPAIGASSPPSPAAPHPQVQQQQAPTSPQHTPAAHGEAPGVDRDVPPVDAAAHDDADSRIDAADTTSDDEAYSKKNGSRNWMPNASCADSASGGPGGDSDIGSVGGGVAFATASDLRKADPFAVGVVAYALLSGCFPWAGETPARLLDTMHGGVRMKAPAWSDVSDAGRDLVRHLLCHNPGERPTVEHALEHPWFLSSVTTPTRPC